MEMQLISQRLSISYHKFAKTIAKANQFLKSLPIKHNHLGPMAAAVGMGGRTRLACGLGAI